MGAHILDFFLAGLALYLIIRYVRRRSMLLPPGPPGWPLIGNLLDMRTEAPYKSFGAMNSKYGPVISISIFGVQCVFLNSTKAAKDLLEKKGAITADRPRFTMGGDLVGWGKSTGFLQNGDTLRKHRKLFGQYILNKSSLEAFFPAKVAEAKQFLRMVLKNPDDLIVHCRTTTAALILKISHGYSVKDESDPLVEMSNEVMRIISETMTPGRYLVDSLPFLRHLPEWFPGCGFLKDAKRWRKMVDEAVSMPHQFVLEQLANGNAVPSFTSRLLEDGASAEDEETLKWISFTMYLAGSDATPSMLSAFFLAMTMYPEVFKKAQAEVDAVIGSNRLPTFEDRDTLPYVNAVVTELLRWNVLVPIISHVSTKDIIYEGYFIPKGTCLIPNIWFILNNPETYPDPDIFDPERFLGEDQQPDPRDACFGWGRRMCMGTRMVDAVVFIYTATALATLDVSRHVENGVELVPKHEYDEGILRYIKPFKCKIAPRSKQIEDLLRA